MAEVKEATAGKVVSMQDVFDGYASKATKDKSHEVDILNSYEIKFTKDFRGHKSGNIANVSKVAMDFYIANKVAEEVKK
jgi:hypothetical protein